MIRHMVVFKLHHRAGSPGEMAFFERAKALRQIPGVKNFQAFREVSPKNAFDYGFAMEFADSAAYDGYNLHPAHITFVKDVWLRDVDEFQEIDLVAL